MDIHAIAYKNIGPFAGKTVTVQFRKGAFLIKAPIGSGKSFLFFDGPIFALYKYGSRQMLSRTKKHGMIRCIFTHNDMTWLVERSITPTKAGNDSTKSRLFRIDMSGEQIAKKLEQYEILEWGKDLCKPFIQGAEEVEFANQREFEDTLSEYLPAKEVTNAVYIMMQDSDHVFSLPPAERIKIFKHLFGMLGIDDAKETLQQKRRDLQSKLSVMEDDANAIRKLKNYLETIKDIKSFFVDTIKKQQVESIWEKLHSIALISDIGLLNENLSFDGLALPDEDLQRVDTAQEAIQELRIASAKYETKIDGLKETKQEKEQALQENKKKISQIKDTIEKVNQQLANFDTDKIDALQEKKKLIEQSIQQKGQAFPQEIFAEHAIEVNSLEQARNAVLKQKEKGKELSSKKEVSTMRLEQYQKTIDEYKKKKSKLEERKKELSKEYDEQMQFHCDKIEGDCPYVEVIKGSAIKSIKKQKQNAVTEFEQFQKEHKEANYEKKLETERKKIAEIEKQQQQIRTLLEQVGWKKVENDYEELQKLYNKRTQVDNEIEQLEKKQGNLEDLKNKRTSLNSKKTVLEEQQDSLQKEFEQARSSLQDVSKKHDEALLQEVEEAGEKLQKLARTFDAIRTLITDHNEKKQERLALKDRLDKVKTLYQIFSKELLVVVLQDFLPQLEEVINAYLSQVVSYEIRFATPKTVDDDLELDITIVDERGEREVKTLSGGQKAILKICRILAVASLMSSKFLFLDETITSLDASAVGRVGDLLKQFVQKNDMKLYVVTHAQQIQQMDLWQEIITIDKSNTK